MPINNTLHQLIFNQVYLFPCQKELIYLFDLLFPLFLANPTYGDNGFEQKGINLGNISADVAVGKTWPSKTITIVGVFAGFPTATDKAYKNQ